MRTYLGVFLIAFSTLALEITLSRLLSVVTWYHLAFFAVSTAMLGMTAGATTVYLLPESFHGSRLNHSMARASLAYSFATPISLIVLCILPLQVGRTVMSLFVLIIATLACALPFYFAGIVVTSVLTKVSLPIGRLYSSDLVGASAGCLFVLGGLEVFDAPSLILLCGSIGSLAALCFTHRATSPGLARTCLWTLALMALAGVANSTSYFGIRPFVVKGRIAHPETWLSETWNSYSRVVVYKLSETPPQLWGPSPMAPTKPIEQHQMTIDGAAGTVLRRFRTRTDIEHLRFDVTNVAYYLRPDGGACIIGVGGGKDIQSAILFGHRRVVGIDVNPVFIDLLENRFREFAGIANHQGVRMVVDEARSYLSRTDEQFSIIQMSLVDTWAATGAGAFSLTENALYTVEGWQVFFRRLDANGVFTVSRWYDPTNLGETGRVISLAVATLLEEGIRSPRSHLALVTSSSIATLLMGRRPFTEQDIATLKKASSDLQYDLVLVPGDPAGDPVLEEIVSATSATELDTSIRGKALNYKPSTDDNPYFFNMLRLRNMAVAVRSSGEGILRGNLLATITLVGLIAALGVVAAGTIVLPLLLGGRFIGQGGAAPEIQWAAALYFALIGSGFMLVEIALIQRLSVFLGHPVYALGILLFTIIGSSGVGSFLSERLPLHRTPWIYVYPLAAAGSIILIRFSLAAMTSTMIAEPIRSKILMSIGVLFPLGVLLGFFFPTGMRLVRASESEETPWYWAINGVFGVLCSAVAVLVSIYSGISTNLYLAAACYGMVFLCARSMGHRRDAAVAASTAPS